MRFAVLLSILMTSQAFGQYASDRYYPKEIIKKEKVAACKIYEDSAGTLNLTDEIRYDEDGKETELVSHKWGYAEKFFYNDKGMKIARYFTPEGDHFWERDTLLYNKGGMLTAVITYNYDGSQSKRSEYEYADSQLVKERFFFGGHLSFTSKYTYSDNGRKRVEKRVIKDQPDEISTCFYDQNKNLTEFIRDGEGDDRIDHVYTYDAHGRKTQESLYGMVGHLDQFYRTAYLENGLIDFEEAFTGIKNNDLKQSDYVKTVYHYTYR